MIIDASVVLNAFFPDESQSQAQTLIREHIAGRIKLSAPILLCYEVSNAIWQAERRHRITINQADEILQSISGLNIEIIPQVWGEMLLLVRKYNISVYDAAYLQLAEKTGDILITGDEHMYNAVHKTISWILWIEEYNI